MDLAAKGAKALASQDFDAAVTHYTNAISSSPQAVNYYVQRSIAYTRVSPANHAASLKDAEIGLMLASKRGKRELIVQAQLRRAVALFGLERYGDAKQCLEWVKKLDEKEKSIQIWEIKVDGKLKKLPEADERAQVTVTQTPTVDMPSAKEQEKSQPQIEIKPAESGASGNPAEATSQGVQTAASKIRHEWYQTSDTVVVSLYAKGIPKDKAEIEMQLNSFSICFPLPSGSDFNFSLDPLFAPIDVAKSASKIMSTKVEFALKKMSSGQKWASLESSQQPRAAANSVGDTVKNETLNDQLHESGPSYPYSSRSGPKNWDKVVDDLTKKPKKKKMADEEEQKDEDDDQGINDYDGADPVNGFFQQLYKNADPDTKRAMMKSYQESNGTALSTNWSEVGKGKVETSPPDGMEAKPW
ncbi:MAG: hypothetical protein Q9190_006457 [Brigantiaea leucoxantha]